MTGRLLLMTAYLPVCFGALHPVLNYAWNYAYISTVLCENKDKPQMHCNGKCYLAKQVKKSSEQNSKQNSYVNLKNSNDVNSHIVYSTSLIIASPVGKLFSTRNLAGLFLSPSDIPSPPPKA